MIRGRRTKAPAWTSEEIAILIDVYPREGVDGAADALPERSWAAIQQQAHKLGVRSPYVLIPTPKAKLDGEDLEAAILLREAGQSFENIGKRFGVSEIAAQNAVLIALCPRKGFTPAERDSNGHLMPAGIERLREALRQGRKAVDIMLQLGISAGRIAEERRRYNADLKVRGKRPLPPPGNGARYSGAKIARDVYHEVDRLLMAGHGAPRVAEMTGVSKTHVQRRRVKLVKRLARKGECLTGCDGTGKRIAYRDSLSSVHQIQKDILRRELMKGTPVARAAKIAVVGGSYAYQVRDGLKTELEKKGLSLPAIVRLGAVKAEAVDRALNWLPKGKKNLLVYRRHLIAVDGDQLEAKRRTITELMPKPAPAPAPKRPLTFEEKLALVASGKARLVANLPLRRPDYAGTLGGIATGAL